MIYNSMSPSSLGYMSDYSDINKSCRNMQINKIFDICNFSLINHTFCGWLLINNKDQNIHKSEALKSQDNRTLTLDTMTELNNQNISAEKLLKYRILFKDILALFGLDYRDGLL